VSEEETSDSLRSGTNYTNPSRRCPFDSIVMDCLGPIFSNQKVEYNYALVLCDSNTRYPFAVPLRSHTAKSVCNALLQVFQLVGIPSTIRLDCASNFTSSLTTTFLKILGVVLISMFRGDHNKPVCVNG